MSVIEEVIQRLETLRTNPSSAVVDMLVKIHDQGLQSLPGSEDALRLISNSLLNKAELSSNATSTLNEASDPFPNFLAEDRESSNRPQPRASGVHNHESLTQSLTQVLESYEELLGNYNQDFAEIHARRAEGARETEDEIIARLRDVQLLLLKYPIAGQALFASLVRQGREFAKT